jgi:hypothetical protein
VGKAKPIDFRGFGVNGVDEDAETQKSVSHSRTKSNKQYTYLCSYHPSCPSPSPPSLSLHRLPSVWLSDLSSPSPSPSTHQPVCSSRWTTG